MNFYFSTVVDVETVVNLLLREQALNLLYNHDRKAVGFNSVPLLDENTSVILKFHMLEGKMHHYSLETNHPSYFHTIKQYVPCTEHPVVDLGLAIWRNEAQIHRIHLLKDLKEAKGLIRREQRVQLRSLDLSFMIFLKESKTRLETDTIRSTSVLFETWCSTDRGKECLLDTRRLCDSKLDF